ncbi:hypothetical protein M758_12G180400 [Ceratodon purpureus]|nr:hypothetical protein M758_12G180400 [Ceratodon purpureus]
MSMRVNSLLPQGRGTCGQTVTEHACLGNCSLKSLVQSPLIQSHQAFVLRLSSRKTRGAKIRPGTVSPRATVEPRQYFQGERKCAPLFENVGESLPSGSSEWRAVPDIWKTAAEQYGDRVALVDPHRQPPAQITYKQLEQSILDFAEGLRVCGIRPDQHMSLFADNSHRWLIADQGIMAAGAAAAVRGSRSSADELYHIFTHSDSVALVVDNLELYNKIASRLKGSTVIKFVIVLWGSKDNLQSNVNGSDVPFYSFDDLITSGRTSRQALAAVASSGERVQYDVIRPDDVATLVYTSGTTGNPKGVMLTHANLLHQIVHLGSVVQPQPGDRILSLLPPWHMYERSAEYFSLSRGVTQVYTSVKSLKEDLARYPPDYFIAVPLVFDILYSGVQKQLAAASNVRKQVALTLLSLSLKFVDFKRIQEGRDVTKAKESFTPVEAAKEWAIATIGALILLPFHLMAQKLVYSKILASIGIKKAAISGGGSLPPYVDKFFEAVGIRVLNGYGLTETAPVLTCRLPSNNVLGTVGGSLPETEMKVVDPDTGNIVPPGIKGIVKVRGPQVMKGYYKNPTATSKAIDSEGWFETGDLGWKVPSSTVGPARMCGGLLVLDGRAKDTIVLSSGENYEPQEIEEAILQSKLIQNVVLVGQDQRRLGALIVPSEELQAAVKTHKQANGDLSKPTKDEMINVIREELNQLLAKSSWPVGPLVLIEEPFTVLFYFSILFSLFKCT